jgi:hypothetical protein
MKLKVKGQKLKPQIKSKKLGKGDRVKGIMRREDRRGQLDCYYLKMIL